MVRPSNLMAKAGAASGPGVQARVLARPLGSGPGTGSSPCIKHQAPIVKHFLQDFIVIWAMLIAIWAMFGK